MVELLLVILWKAREKPFTRGIVV